MEISVLTPSHVVVVKKLLALIAEKFTSGYLLEANEKVAEYPLPSTLAVFVPIL